MTSIYGATAHPAGLGSGARLPSSAPLSYGTYHRTVPAHALYLAVPVILAVL